MSKPPLPPRPAQRNAAAPLAPRLAPIARNDLGLVLCSALALGLLAAVGGCAPNAGPRALGAATATGGAPSSIGAAARSDVAAAEARITPEVLRAPIRFLADDLLEGRGPGTRGDALARLYVSSAMEMIGLAPGSADGTFEQSVDLLGVTTTAPRQWRFAAGPRALELESGRDFVATAGTADPRVAVGPAEIVFVGYGIAAPEFEWDDFKGADLRGKILLVLNNDPDWDEALFAGKRRLYYGRWTYKYESAARQGAVGAIVIHSDDSAGYPWQTVQASWSGENSRLAAPRLEPELGLRAWVTDAAAARLAALGGHSLTDLVAAARRRDFAPIPLGITTSIALRNELRPYRTANVLGVLRGSDPDLGAELVVYSAHHDHLGVKPGNDGKPQIYNGALDNAAGVAQLLAIAQALRSMPAPPRRSILFLALAAEEQGLLGSEYFAAHPTVPAGRIAADINFDGGNVWGRTRDYVSIGYGKSDLDALVAAAAARQGRRYEGDPFPERGSFYRSDQFNFARIGVPSVYGHEGTDFVGKPAGFGREQLEQWIAQHYHQPSDDFDPSWDLAGMVDDARLALDVGLAVADADAMPRWTPGDEFEPARQRALWEAGAPADAVAPQAGAVGGTASPTPATAR